MEALLLAFGFAFMAASTAVVLRTRIGSLDASDEIAAARRKLALKLRSPVLQSEAAPGGQHRLLHAPVPARKAHQVFQPHSAPLALPSKEFALSALLPRDRTLAEAAGRLHTLKVLLPEEPLPGDKYMAELHSILDFMEKGSGLDLSRYRVSAPVARTFLRINILALLAVCVYQSRSAAMPQSYVRTMPQASRRVH